MADISSGEQRAEIFYDSAFRKFGGLAALPGAILQRHISLAGRIVRIEISAGAMERAVMPALSHLIVPEVAEPDLVLCVWDCESTGAPPMSPGWGPEDYRREGYISGFNDARFHTGMQFEPIILRMIDMERRRAMYWTADASKLPYWEIGAPLRPLLHEWLQRVGMVAIHGGAVGRADGGVFLAGAGGQGKSNVALACLNSDLLYASDDFCFLSQSPEWTAHSLYCTGKMAAGDLVRHPYLRGVESNPDRLDREKALFFLNEKFADRLIRQLPLRAIVLPRVIAQGPSKIVPVASAVAHKAIAMSTIELSRWTGGHTLRKVSELLRERPCYELCVGASIDEVPPLLDKLLNELRRNRHQHAPRGSGGGRS
jgi:hypothetical protein